MSAKNWRPVKTVTLNGVSVGGILSINYEVDTGLTTEATDGFAHKNNGVLGAKSTTGSIRLRNLDDARSVLAATPAGSTSWTEIGLGSSTDKTVTASGFYVKSLKISGDVPAPYSAELAFECVTESASALTIT